MNLFLNAFESMGDRGTLIINTSNVHGSVQANTNDDKRDLENCRCVKVQRSDTVSGISEDDIDHIFEPFYSRKVLGRSGTGLGLAVVWNTIQDHNGRITVASSSSGTTFELFLPATDRREVSRKPAVDASDFRGHGETILVVDDEKGLRDITCTMLDSMGYKSESVSSGEQAVELVCSKKTDLIVLDMIIEPGLNGIETYRQILQFGPDQKAIIVSGFAENANVAVAKRLGVSAYIKKTITHNGLGMHVKTALAADHI
jgi:CheY-like chemotaxis protein